MTLPSLHNNRVPRQWEIISQHIDFKGKKVLDLGCGYGDILFRCVQAGVSQAWGVEQNEDICRYLWSQNSELRVVQEDIQEWIRLRTIPHFDIVICFSVLPYLYNFGGVRYWIRNHSDVALIEMQYFGDGPGIEFIKSDDDMRNWLADWQSAKPIGKTLIADRQKWRTIWLCE